MARLTRVMTGHAPVGAFRDRFNLDGLKQCPCGNAEPWTRAHTLLRCDLWYREHSWFSRLLDHLKELDPFVGLISFLKANPLAFTFEFSEYWEAVVSEEEANHHIDTTLMSDDDFRRLFPALIRWTETIIIPTAELERKAKHTRHVAEGRAQAQWAAKYGGRPMPRALQGFEGSQVSNSSADVSDNPD